MAEYEQSTVKVEEGSTVEATDRGLFGFGGKKEEDKKPHEEAICTEFDEKVQVSEPCTEFDEKVQVSEPEEKKHGSLLEKLHRSGSSSCSSSDEEEVEEGGEKKKKKKGLKEKILGDKKEEEKTECKHEEDTSIPVEKYDEPALAAETVYEPEEKKGFLDKIKDKLPGGQKKTEEVAAPSPPAVVDYNTPTATATATEGDEAKEKKGFLDKIKEKLPGYHPKITEEEKEKEKEKEEAASHY